MERTVIVSKSNGHLGSLIARLEQKGYKILALKLVSATEANQFQQQAQLDNAPSVVMVWNGPNVVIFGRQLYQLSECQITYASVNDFTAREDISFWFGELNEKDPNPKFFIARNTS